MGILNYFSKKSGFYCRNCGTQVTDKNIFENLHPSALAQAQVSCLKCFYPICFNSPHYDDKKQTLKLVQVYPYRDMCSDGNSIYKLSDDITLKLPTNFQRPWHVIPEHHDPWGERQDPFWASFPWKQPRDYMFALIFISEQLPSFLAELARPMSTAEFIAFASGLEYVRQYQKENPAITLNAPFINDKHTYIQRALYGMLINPEFIDFIPVLYADKNIPELINLPIGTKVTYHFSSAEEDYLQNLKKELYDCAYRAYHDKIINQEWIDNDFFQVVRLLLRLLPYTKK